MLYRGPTKFNPPSPRCSQSKVCISVYSYTNRLVNLPRAQSTPSAFLSAKTLPTSTPPSKPNCVAQLPSPPSSSSPNTTARVLVPSNALDGLRPVHSRLFLRPDAPASSQPPRPSMFGRSTPRKFVSATPRALIPSITPALGPHIHLRLRPTSVPARLLQPHTHARPLDPSSRRRLIHSSIVLPHR